MVLAHATGSTGPHAEFLVVAGALLVLGVLFYIQKAVKPVVSLVLVLVALALGSGAFLWDGESAAQGRSVVITEPKPGDTVPKEKPVTLEVAVTGGTLAADSDDPQAGHLHITVDGVLVKMPSTATPKVEFERGRHTLMVEFVDLDHLSYSPPVRDEIEIEAR